MPTATAPIAATAPTTWPLAKNTAQRMAMTYNEPNAERILACVVMTALHGQPCGQQGLV